MSVIPCSFNALFYSAHPNIFVLLSALKKTELNLHENEKRHYTKTKNQLQSKKRTSSSQKLDTMELT